MNAKFKILLTYILGAAAAYLLARQFIKDETWRMIVSILAPAALLFFATHFFYTVPIKKICEEIKSIDKNHIGKINGAKGKCDDITALEGTFKNMQDKMKTAFGELDKKMLELTKKNAELQILQAFFQKISNILELETLKQFVINFLIDEMKIELAVLLHWPEKESSVISLRKKNSEEIVSGYLDLANPEEENISPRAFFNRENILAKLGINEDEYTVAPDEQSSLFLILKLESKIIGLLGLVKKEKEAFSKDEIEIFSMISRNLSICIHRAMLYESAITDNFTGFYLKKYFEFLLAAEVDRSKRYNRNISILTLELDNFDNLVQSYGQTVGNIAIKQICGVIKTFFRKTDTISRFTNNEFAIILPETGYNHVLVIAKRFQKNIQMLWLNIPESKIQIKLNISIGISIYPIDGNDPDILLQKSLDALKNARNVSQTKICFAKDLAG